LLELLATLAQCHQSDNLCNVAKEIIIMDTTYNPLSPQQLGTANVGDTGMFTGTLPNQAPIFPQIQLAGGITPVGGNPILQTALQDQRTIGANYSNLLSQRQESGMEYGSTAAQLANQIAAMKIRQAGELQQNQIQQAELVNNLKQHNLFQGYGGQGADYGNTLVAPNIANPAVLQNPNALQAASQVNQYNTGAQILPLQQAIEMNKATTAQSVLPIQQQMLQTQQAAGLATNQQQFLTNQSVLQNFSKYNINPQQLTPLDITQAGTPQEAQTQLQRVSQGNQQDLLSQLPGIANQLQNGQSVQPQSVLQDPGFLALRQQDTQRANNLYYTLFGRTADQDIQRVGGQIQAANQFAAEAVDKEVAQGTLRQNSDGTLSKSTMVAGAPSGSWYQEGSAQFSQEQADLFRRGIQTGKTSLSTQTSPRDMMLGMMRRGASVSEARQALLAYIAQKNQPQQQQTSDTTLQDYSESGIPLRPLTPIQQAIQPNGLFNAVNYLGGKANSLFNMAQSFNQQ
jgi:hypothetical protein